MKQKINSRLFIIAIIAVFATTFGITYVHYNLFQKQVKADLKTSALVLKDTRYFESVNIDRDEIDLSTDIDDLRVTWIASDGTVLYDNDTSAALLENHGNRPEVREALESKYGESIRKSDTMNMSTFYYAILLDNGTVLRVATDAENIHSVFYKSAPMIGIIICLIIVICIAISHMVTKQLIIPIETMAENMEDTNIEPPYKELKPFAEMIRKQHTEVLSAAKIRQDFTANVSHELKTPLTAISGYAELMENHMVDKESQDHVVREIQKNAERLLTLINDIIRLSELDHSENKIQFEEIDLNHLIIDAIEPLKVHAQRRNIHINYDGESCLIRGNKEMLRELIDNLVENAIRYNNDGGRVWIRIVIDEGIKKLVLKDNGIGIPKEDQERVFERFYRVDKSRSKATGGTGLGLAIVKHIVELHDAKLMLESELGKGTRITIYF